MTISPFPCFYREPSLLSVSGTNSRYFVNRAGDPVFLTGFHTWGDVQDGDTSYPPATFDWDAYLTALVAYGCNFTKLWTLECWGWSDTNAYLWDPPRYERTGPGNGNDGLLKFDLTQINAAWLTRLRARVIACGQQGIYVCVQMYDGWNIESKGMAGTPWDYHPYNADNNINSLDGDFNADDEGTETHTDTNNAAYDPYQIALVQTIVDTVGDRDNVIWEVSNESTGGASALAWQEDIVAVIKAREDSNGFRRHPIGITKLYPENAASDDDDLYSCDADWVSYSTTYADAEVDGAKVSMYDTDHTVGLETTYQWVWECLCNGHGGAWFMDSWDGKSYSSGDWRENATYILIRDQLGYANDIANGRVTDLLGMTPQSALCSTGWCLAKDHATAAEYICFQDGSGNFTLDLTTATGTLNIFWRRCSNGDTDTDTVAGGAERTLTVPWAGTCVAYVYH